MKLGEAHLVKKSDKNYRVKRPTQTGFSSPATHYTEPRIDLNDVLINNASATFYVRVVDNGFSDFDIHEKDVLIIDKSLTPKQNQLALVTKEGAFEIIRIDKKATEEAQLWGVITYIIKSTL